MIFAATDKGKRMIKLFYDNKKEPYVTIEVEKKEDFDFLNERLEKQIAKRPVKCETQDMRYVTIYSCLVCSKGIVGTNIAKFCFHCGQKLEWSDE